GAGRAPRRPGRGGGAPRGARGGPRPAPARSSRLSGSSARRSGRDTATPPVARCPGTCIGPSVPPRRGTRAEIRRNRPRSSRTRPPACRRRGGFRAQTAPSRPPPRGSGNRSGHHSFRRGEEVRTGLRKRGRCHVGTVARTQRPPLIGPVLIVEGQGLGERGGIGVLGRRRIDDAEVGVPGI